MKIVIIIFFAILYAIKINSAEFRMDAYGYDKLSYNLWMVIYVDYSNDAIVLTTTGISGTANANYRIINIGALQI